ncbi:FAD-dependent monooxygenase [Streptomyces sp. WAC05374]|uniref:FAD-dependent oxidoreductase n=1 Tax=Streptomyces sp. WAC05374 TaxID=2487420 RepID=UPI000F86B49F|nr:FAD-dependent oxidoreductase [Streptomyces sp. WAC05374]RST19043.1 FAD-dependent monooxygenase [Streptomyces sp. WAC05374]TDF36989.1 FAD-dependent monooxygenase [Streptomyces sp. WAC05374]TDF46484.1 FAD-dependent monooxygenase [Streptomyces sp. WAC05374]TDF47585.1 FAD-dependent monooxygenase [Streptomyces sp. WAC05374]
MARVAVIGGGISGLGTALMLGRRGHTVTVFEQDGREAGEDLDRDFLDWNRPRVPQANQPHSFLAPVRTVLRTETPDVYADLLARGAREYHDFDWFGEHPPHRAGDDDLVTLRTRRIVLEAALSAAVRREPTVDVRRGHRVRALAFGKGRPVRVTGVRVGTDTHRADLVVDASGRRSPVPGLLTAAGCRPPVVESHRAGIAYLCRWYRLRADGPRDPGRVKTGSAAPFALAGVFPSDNDTFAISMVLSTADPTRGALRDPAVFEAVARCFPATAAWLDLAPAPQTAVLAMAGLDNRWTSLADADGPVVTGLVNAGDSLVHTNPTLGHGVALGLRAAQHLAAHADQVAADPTGYHTWTARALRPWFDAQVTADRGNEQRLAEGSPSSDRRAAALAACAFDDPVVMRARAQVRHLLKPADDAYGTDEVDRAVTAWLDARPDFSPTHDGPTRDQWDALVPG